MPDFRTGGVDLCVRRDLRAADARSNAAADAAHAGADHAGADRAHAGSDDTRAHKAAIGPALCGLARPWPPAALFGRVVSVQGAKRGPEPRVVDKHIRIQVPARR